MALFSCPKKSPDQPLELDLFKGMTEGIKPPAVVKLEAALSSNHALI